MVVPPDYHDGQRLVTHKLRVSGCDVDTERSYDTFGNVVLDLSSSTSSATSSSPPGSSSSARPRVDGSGRAGRARPTRASREPSRLTEPDDALRAVADELRAHRPRGRRAGRRRSAAASTSTSRTGYGMTTVSTHRGGGVGGRASACARTTRTACSRSAGCAGCPARYVSGHLLGEGGTHAWVEVLVAASDGARTRCAPSPSTRRTTAARACTTSRVAVGRDYADVPPTSGTFDGAVPRAS